MALLPKLLEIILRIVYFVLIKDLSISVESKICCTLLKFGIIVENKMKKLFVGE